MLINYLYKGRILLVLAFQIQSILNDMLLVITQIKILAIIQIIPCGLGYFYITLFHIIQINLALASRLQKFDIINNQIVH